MEINWTDLRYVLLTPGADEAQSLQAEAFRFWHQSWFQTYKELNGIESLHSDDFSRQDTLGCLFLGPRCVGLSCFRTCDLSHPMTRSDSYFYWWPDSALKRLAKNGAKVLIASQITVDPECRGELPGGIKLKYVLAGLHAKMLLDSDCNAMPLVPRRDRGMDRVAYRYGATLLDSELELHGVPVEIAAIYRKSIVETPIDFDTPVSLLWENRSLHGIDEMLKAG